jgi:hypothetical protein
MITVDNRVQDGRLLHDGGVTGGVVTTRQKPGPFGIKDPVPNDVGASPVAADRGLRDAETPGVWSIAVLVE